MATTQTAARPNPPPNPQSGGQGVGEPVACPVETLTLEAEVLDEQGVPLHELVVQLQNASKQVVRTITSRAGVATFRGLLEGDYLLSLPELDGAAWSLESQRELGTKLAAKSPAWGALPANAPRPSKHEVEQGESTASLAARFGLLPQSLWDANPTLKKERKHENVLFPGDELKLPALKPRDEPAKAGFRYSLRRKGLGETLSVCFQAPSGEPRVKTPYLATFKTRGGETLASRRGETDAEGVLIEPVPADVAEVEVLLGRGSEREEHHYKVGFMDPISTVSGVQARLNCLGFPCGEEDGEFSEYLMDVLAQFQRFHGLPVSGEACAATRDKLVELHRS